MGKNGYAHFFKPERFVDNNPTAMNLLLLILLIVVLLSVLPAWPYSSGWGYYPSGTVGLIVLILVILLLTGRI